MLPGGAGSGRSQGCREAGGNASSGPGRVHARQPRRRGEHSEAACQSRGELLSRVALPGPPHSNAVRFDGHLHVARRRSARGIRRRRGMHGIDRRAVAVRPLRPAPGLPRQHAAGPDSKLDAGTHTRTHACAHVRAARAAAHVRARLRAHTHTNANTCRRSSSARRRN